jgi:hypothetical protein
MARRILPNHLDDLRRSGLSDATIESWGCFSIEQESASELKSFGKGVTTPGLALPMMAPGSLEPAGFSYKPDHPRMLKRNGKERTLKYELPRRGLNRIHVPRGAQYLFRPPDGREGPMRMVITEGQKKAEKATQEGIACVALPGVWNWLANFGGESVPIEDLAAIEWPRYAVEICFDSDAASNPHVHRAEKALARWLRSRGAATVSIVRILQAEDGSKIGLDDFLINHSAQDFENLPRRDEGDLPLAEAVDLLKPDTEKKERSAVLGRIRVEETDPAERERLLKIAAGRTGISLKSLRASSEAAGSRIKKTYTEPPSVTPEELEKIRNERREAVEAILNEAHSRTILRAQTWAGEQLIYVCPFGDGETLVLSSSGTVISGADLPTSIKLPPSPPDRSPLSPDGVRRFMAGDSVPAIRIFDDLRQWFSAHAIFKHSSVATALALWTMGTYAHVLFNYYGYIWFTSLGPSHGKSLVEKILSMLCFNAGAPITSPTPATIFRDTEANAGTMILDEIEGLDPEKKGDVISILNAGFERGGCVPRSIPTGDSWVTRRFSVYSPKAIAGISHLPHTLHTRVFQIDMPKRKASEAIQTFEPDRLAHPAEILRDDQAICALRNASRIAEMYAGRSKLVACSDASTKSPIPDRLRDILAPLYAIAAVIDLEAGELVATPGLDGFAAIQAGSRNSDPVFEDYAIALHALFAWATPQWRNGKVLIKTREAMLLFKANEIGWASDSARTQALLRKLGGRNQTDWWKGELTRGYVFHQAEMQDLVERHPIRAEEPLCQKQER